jgi:hypothetical protein
MRLLKPFLITVSILLLLATGISMLIPANNRISRAINITAPKDSVLAALHPLNHWVNWYPGLKAANAVVTPNSIQAAESSAIQLINRAGDTVLLQWQGKHQYMGAMVVLQPEGEQGSIVQWYIDMQTNWYPWEKFASIFNDQIMGPQMDATLKELKAWVETVK